MEVAGGGVKKSGAFWWKKCKIQGNDAAKDSHLENFEADYV